MKVQPVSYKEVKETLFQNEETKALYLQEKCEPASFLTLERYAQACGAELRIGIM